MKPNIALYGKTGSGKTTLAKYLVERYDYQRLSTGAACRQISKRIYGDDSKANLNLITDAIKEADPEFWLRTAISSIKGTSPIVFDSMRFAEDYSYFQNLEYALWKIMCPLDIRVLRLAERGQIFNSDTDEEHPAEISIDTLQYDITLNNETTPFELFALVDGLIAGAH